MAFKTYLLILLFAVALSINFKAAAENKRNGLKPDTGKRITDTIKNKPEKSGVKFSLNYITNNVFMGRADSISTAIIIPQIRYYFKSGIYLSGSLEIIPNRRKNKVDGGDITVGYDFDITNDLSGGVSYAKPFYSSTSTQVNSSINSIISANFTYDIGDIISPTISADYDINKRGIAGDIFLNIGITHDFNATGIFGNKDALSISPTLEANTGTQNFYEGYITARKSKNARLNVAETALLQSYTSELSQYKLLDYELSLPVEYKSGNFTVSLIPIYAIAQNQFKSAAIIKTLGLSNKSSVFYFDIGLALKF